MMVRHFALMLPVCVLLALLPAGWEIRLAVPLLALLSSTFVVALNTGEIRRSRLRQHGLPTDTDTGTGPGTGTGTNGPGRT